MLDYIKLGSTNADNVKYVRTDSTQAIKKDATFMRKAGAFNAGTGVYSVPEYGFTFRSDVPNADGDPSGQRLSAGMTIRLPVKATSAMLDEILTDFRAYVNSNEFAGNVVQQLFPCEASCTGPEA